MDISKNAHHEIRETIEIKDFEENKGKWEHGWKWV